MRRFVLVLMAAVLVSAAPALAAETITGELVEMSCHARMDDGATGDDHAACALKCARGGEDLGILTSGGVYTITGDMVGTDELFGFIAKNVKAAGELSTDGDKMVINVAAIESN